MKKNTKQPASLQTQPILQRERPLVPLEEYAARYGLSRAAIDDFAKMGIVQIRKYKGKTYVVDVPISPYAYAPEALSKPRSPAAPSIEAPQPLQSPKNATTPKTPKVAAKHKLSPTGATINPPAQLNSGYPRQFAAPPQQEFEVQRLDRKRFAPVVVFLIASLAVNVWLSIVWAVQADKLSSSEASVQHFLTLSIEANQKAKIAQSDLVDADALNKRLQKKLDDSMAEIEFLRQQLAGAETRSFQNQLYNSGSELKNIRSELTQTQQSLEAAKQRNAELAAWFDEQVQISENRPPQTSGNDSISTEPKVSDPQSH